jgi:hypothetical protein
VVGHHLLPHRQWLCHKRNGHSQFQLSQDGTKGKLQGCCCLDRIALLWHKIHVGLQATPCQLLHAWYINKALKKHQHPTPNSPQDAPFAMALVQYGAKVQQVKINTTSPLSPAVLKRVQDIVGTLLYYAQVVDPTILAALSAIAVQQSNSTQAVAEACNQLLNYIATHPNAGLQYHACDMILAVHTDASYLSKAGGKSRAAGHFYLTN